jgi:hypothetical protein
MFEVQGAGSQAHLSSQGGLLMTLFGQDDPEPLEELGQRYELLHQLREEPWGEVWLALDRVLGAEVALKLFLRSDPDWDRGRKILAREAVLSLSLRHSLILGVFFLGETDDGLYLVEEPFAGESLMALLSRKQRFSLPQTLRLLEQVGQALAFAHLRGVAHQAFNPLHILLKGEEVRLANFACPPGEEEPAIHMELKAYPPPEVLHGEEATPAGNVFSLGVLGYRLLAGSLPYPLTFDEPFPYRLESMPVDLEEIPLPLQNLLLQCLAPSPEDRFIDAGAFLTQLRQLRELWQGGGRETWLLEEPVRSLGAWRQTGPHRLAGILGKIAGGGKAAAGKLSAGLRSSLSRGAPGSRRLWWGLGLAGAILLLIILGSQVQRHLTPAPEPPGGSAALSPPSPGAASPLKAKEEPGAPVAPAPAATPGPAPAAAPAPPPRLAAPKPVKPTHKEDKYLVIAATFHQLHQARVLAKRLQAHKYQVRIIKTKVKGKVAYQVRLGPFTARKAALETAKHLKTKEHLKPALVKIKPKRQKAAASRGGTR